MGADNQAEKVMDRIARLEAAEVEIERLRANTTQDQSLIGDLLLEKKLFNTEIERLRERIGPQGLEVVLIDDTGHYVNAKVKAEIERLRAENERLRAEKENALATQNLMADEIERLNSKLEFNERGCALLQAQKEAADAEIEQLRLLLARCRTILNNMAWEHEHPHPWWGNRWPISHEPLRADAKALLPLVDEELRRCPTVENPTSNAS